MSAMDTDHPYTDDTFHTHLAYHRGRALEDWAGCKWCMRERQLADYKKAKNQERLLNELNEWWAKKRPVKPS